MIGFVRVTAPLRSSSFSRFSCFSAFSSSSSSSLSSSSSSSLSFPLRVDSSHCSRSICSLSLSRSRSHSHSNSHSNALSQSISHAHPNRNLNNTQTRMMQTTQQLLGGIRRPRFRKDKRAALQGCPQKKGVCLRVYVTTPRKPNSALRKVARVFLSNKVKITAYIPGIGHNLKQHSVVLVRGGRIKDLPGMKYRLIRGKYDLKRVEGRKNGRSKYGTKSDKAKAK